ncbi:uncharacterized protein LOC123556590 [Mercenaria mercenaria]|uniref:uncharacterized protein LOC123556590 n=1 Tax=Mercenaria mercenaria TaxID=6596 RepID=UPI00234E5567|nr:uncharacterized protein LOC123556590 [Mercenaria mercenaria]
MTGSGDLWGKISNMEESFRKREEAQTEILANIVLNVAKMQQTLDKEKNQSPDVGELINANEEDELDGLLNGGTHDVSEDMSSDFLSDLVNDYEKKTVFGPCVNETLGKLVSNAVDNGMSEEDDKKLCEKYLVPENCQVLRVPKVNRELWNAFKLKRAADLALQTSQKYLSLAMVPVIKSIEVLMEKGDVQQVKDLTKDTFRLLSQGLNVTNRKRRALIRPAIPAKYQKVCEGEGPTSEFLFGEDLDQKVENCEKEERRSQKLGGHQGNHRSTSFLGQRNQKGNRYHPYPHKQMYHQGKQYPTLGRNSNRGKSPAQRGQYYRKK